MFQPQISDSEEELLNYVMPDNPAGDHDEPAESEVSEDEGELQSEEEAPMVPAPIPMAVETTPIDAGFEALIQVRATKQVSGRSDSFPQLTTDGQKRVCRMDMLQPFTSEQESEFLDAYKGYESVFRPPVIDEDVISMLELPNFPPMNVDKKDPTFRQMKGKPHPSYYKEKELYAKQINMAPAVKPLVCLLDEIFANEALSDDEKRVMMKRLTDSIQIQGFKFHTITILRRENILRNKFSGHTLRR